MTGTRPAELLLDGDVVRRRRLELDLLQQPLARMLGVSATTIRRIEEQASRRQMPISLVIDLAVALGLRPGELLRIHPHAAPSAPEVVPGTEPDDAARVGELLGAAGGWVAVSDLADVLGWSLERSLDALAGLSHRLPGVGQRLAWLSDRDVRIVPAPAGRAVATVTRRNLELAGPSQAEALVLYRLIHQGPTIPTRGIDSLAVIRLTAADLIEAADGTAGELTLTELGRYCLGVNSDQDDCSCRDP